MGKTIAIAGATGAVGIEIIRLLEERHFPVSNLKLLASSRSAGKHLTFNGTPVEVQELRQDSFRGVDIAFFSAGAARSQAFCPAAVRDGAVVIDNSSAFRMEPDVPLVVPEVNPEAAFKHRGLIANPNCTTIQMVVALKPLHDAATIRRVIVSTYQSVSGSGAGGIVELENQVRAWVAGTATAPSVYPCPIAFNVIPHVDVFLENGYTKEEMKMVNETRKIMSAPDMQISATCVRVPVIRAHSEAVHVETEKKLTAAQARAILTGAPGIKIKDEQSPGGYPVPLQVTRSWDTWVGRIREDIAVANGLSFWVVADQLYKGAALNAIQIGELLLEQ
jgi:aspartate-semialdehyde dehydrogenase